MFRAESMKGDVCRAGHDGANLHGTPRPAFREVDECELVGAVHIEEDMDGSWLVAILDDLRQAHPEHFGIKGDRSFVPNRSR